MSGLEAIGIAASIIQVADLGTKLSIKLFTLYREIKNANQATKDLASDVSLTCAILRELGQSLKQDERAKLCSKEALIIAKYILNQCEEVMCDIRNRLKKHGVGSEGEKMSAFRRATEKFWQALSMQDLDPLKAKLETLKSTMILMLNVIMFAGQVRNKQSTALEEQRALVERLIGQRRGDKNDPPKGGNSPHDAVNLQQSNITINSIVTPLQTQQPQVSTAHDLRILDELEAYNLLIDKMLIEINSCQSKLEGNRHRRMRKDVLDIHSSEVIRFQLSHGHEVLKCFDQSLLEEKRADVVSEIPPLPTASVVTNPQTQQNSMPEKQVYIDENFDDKIGTQISAIEWPLDKVLAWLKENEFSENWQAAFRTLNVQGVRFIQIGHDPDTEGNIGRESRTIYYQLAKECIHNGDAWDSIQEREQGWRMHRLVDKLPLSVDFKNVSTDVSDLSLFTSPISTNPPKLTLHIPPPQGTRNNVSADAFKPQGPQPQQKPKLSRPTLPRLQLATPSNGIQGVPLGSNGRPASLSLSVHGLGARSQSSLDKKTSSSTPATSSYSALNFAMGLRQPADDSPDPLSTVGSELAEQYSDGSSDKTGGSVDTRCSVDPLLTLDQVAMELDFRTTSLAKLEDTVQCLDFESLISVLTTLGNDEIHRVEVPEFTDTMRGLNCDFSID